MINNRDEFIKHVKFDLYSGDVRNMRPETLGKIMCSFDVGDVMASKKNLFDGVSFSHDCEAMLRESVALCLANAITLRLDVLRSPGVPAYKWLSIQDSGFRKVIDDIPSRQRRVGFN